MAIAALLLWMCTAAVGAYQLASGIRASRADSPATPQQTEHAQVQHARQVEHAQQVPASAPATPKPVRARDRFDPPSLTRAKNEPLPGLRALAEFTHPALAIIGFGFWLSYVLIRDRVFAAIGFGVLLGVICAGLAWFAGNTRAARRGVPGAMSFPPRVLILHAVGAALTLLLAALIVAHV